MKKLLGLLIFILLISGCNVTEHREEVKLKKQYKLLKKQYKLVDVYKQTFSRYCANKFDGYNYSYITRPDGITKLKYENPSLYELEIKPIEVVWDSLLMVSEYAAEMSGLSEEMIKSKIKIKEKEKTKIKVKKSDNVTINNIDVEAEKVNLPDTLK